MTMRLQWQGLLSSPLVCNNRTLWGQKIFMKGKKSTIFRILLVPVPLLRFHSEATIHLCTHVTLRVPFLHAGLWSRDFLIASHRNGLEATGWPVQRVEYCQAKSCLVNYFIEGRERRRRERRKFGG